MESLTSDEFARIEAYDQVMPLDHPSRMLGLIAFMLGRYLGMEEEGEDGAFRKVCMPWLPDKIDSTSTAIASLSPILKPVRTDK